MLCYYHLFLYHSSFLVSGQNSIMSVWIFMMYVTDIGLGFVFRAVVNPDSAQFAVEVDQVRWSLLFFFSHPLYPGVLAKIEMPQSSVEVIKGDRAVLRASYRTPPGTDLRTNIVLWNFYSTDMKPVSVCVCVCVSTYSLTAVKSLLLCYCAICVYMWD